MDDEQTAVAGRAGGLARVALDDDGAGHHVLGEPVLAFPCTRTVACLFMPAQ